MHGKPPEGHQNDKSCTDFLCDFKSVRLLAPFPGMEFILFREGVLWITVFRTFQRLIY